MTEDPKFRAAQGPNATRRLTMGLAPKTMVSGSDKTTRRFTTGDTQRVPAGADPRGTAWAFDKAAPYQPGYTRRLEGPNHKAMRKSRKLILYLAVPIPVIVMIAGGLLAFSRPPERVERETIDFRNPTQTSSLPGNAALGGDGDESDPLAGKIYESKDGTMFRNEVYKTGNIKVHLPLEYKTPSAPDLPPDAEGFGGRPIGPEDESPR